ncbi:alkanesulfonate monooxygenase SsuD/methylene tetrahydromethanopterin reductase-like flavin-dependent oxidoreductase (luciferase family) [Paractinoplanes brasiliensis]|uniref:Alkanesulfonate monooxygenase SsuD/methylene tetrahydromethanopterin reductase-like flavin-dependent oxidoreductase (Luciferase family) n=2 Tax=Paractinoplanes brasiliensis TaxID=52695 RepID=A0A4R6JAE2_9ACTN|nr:alkanesulfonate monooxygenase SsuD/methylene tetrahydromethanopterin reductase-like flavin-dependent oxidoreductase (luciferase family) [Actinoplanes brasiliensis]GID27943.1 N5,N10-methylene tetrahydromethanopterin reductase [Actinoplanes brasiliensis]
MVSRVGVMVPRDLPVDEVLGYAQRAEELGFDELWVVEDLGFRGGVAQAGAVLARTSRITVGIGILPAGARNAAFAAMELATLAQLFPGRVIAGIGHGMPDWMRQVGAWPASPLTLLEEYTIAVRTLLRGEPGPASGRYVKVEGVVIGEKPLVAPPVVLGVRGPRSITVAGRVADGVLLAEPAAPPYVEAAVRQMGGGTRPAGAGRPSDAGQGERELEVITYDAAVVGDDGRAARDLVRPGLAWIGEPDWAPHLAAMPFAEDLARHRRASAGPEEFAATMPDEWVRELALAGTADDVRAQIAARHAAGATSVVMIPAEPDRLDSLNCLARVLPH